FLLLAALAAATLAEGSMTGGQGNSFSDALHRLSNEKVRLLNYGRRYAPEGTRSNWYLGKESGGMDAAREMIRRMIEPQFAGENATARFRTAGRQGLAEVIRREAAAGSGCSTTGTGRLAGKRIVLDAG